jgi:hypothetical protein
VQPTEMPVTNVISDLLQTLMEIVNGKIKSPNVKMNVKNVTTVETLTVMLNVTDVLAPTSSMKIKYVNGKINLGGLTFSDITADYPTLTINVQLDVQPVTITEKLVPYKETTVTGELVPIKVLYLMKLTSNLEIVRQFT